MEVKTVESLELEVEDRKEYFRPVIKCPGGKGRLLDVIFSHFPKDIAPNEVFAEPFTGGGSVLFRAASRGMFSRYILNDVNLDLVNVYRCIRDNLPSLLEELEELKNLNDKESYLVTRAEFNSNRTRVGVKQAARFIYLNKLGYNGLIRYNRKGGFNVPFGRYKNPRLYNDKVLDSVSSLFNEEYFEIYNRDFGTVIWKSLSSFENVFFYLDPPYDVLSSTSNFAEYTSQGFSKEDHLRLRSDLDLINERGGRFLLSSSDTEFIRYSFSDYDIIEIKALRSINSKKDKRGKVSELLIKNY